MANEGTVPIGLNLTANELRGGSYPNLESIPGRLRGAREMNMILPPIIWYPRAVRWAQGLHAMAEIREFGGFA